MMAAKTKEERFVVELYDQAEDLGDFEEFIEVSKVADAVGLGPKAIKNVLNTLAGANFIRKRSPNQVALTQNGIRLAEELLG